MYCRRPINPRVIISSTGLSTFFDFQVFKQDKANNYIEKPHYQCKHALRSSSCLYIPRDFAKNGTTFLTGRGVYQTHCGCNTWNSSDFMWQAGVVLVFNEGDCPSSTEETPHSSRGWLLSPMRSNFLIHPDPHREHEFERRDDLDTTRSPSGGRDNTGYTARCSVHEAVSFKYSVDFMLAQVELYTD